MDSVPSDLDPSCSATAAAVAVASCLCCRGMTAVPAVGKRSRVLLAASVASASRVFLDARPTPDTAGRSATVVAI